MKIKQTILAIVVLLGLGFIFTPVITVNAAKCGTETIIIDCPEVTNNPNDSINKNGLWAVLLQAINILTAGVGIAAIGGIVYGSISYTSAAGNAEQAKKAITIIKDVVLGLIAYIFMFALLNFIIPGGFLTS